MTGFLRSLTILLAAPWVGGLLWVGFVFAPYLFILASDQSSAVPNSSVAAQLIGPLLGWADLVSLITAASLLVCLLILRRRHLVPLGSRFFVSESALCVALACTAVNFFLMTPALKDAQQQLASKYGGFHLADRTDKIYASFSSLHQLSTVLFVIVFVAALACLICLTQFSQRSHR